MALVENILAVFVGDVMSITQKIINWLFPPRRVHIRTGVPWPEADVRKAIEICLRPFYPRAIDAHRIVVMMSAKPFGHDNAAGASDGHVIMLDSSLVDVPLSETALAHECEHVRQVMLGNVHWWGNHSEEFYEHVYESQRLLRVAGL